MARNVGRKRALEMAFTGDVIDAATAADWGLINRAVPDDELDAAVADLMARATRGSASSKALGKRTFYAQVDLDQAKAYAHAIEVMAAVGHDGRRSGGHRRLPREAHARTSPTDEPGPGKITRMRRDDLLNQLATALADAGPLLEATGWRAQLDAVCDTARIAFGAAAVSIARVDGDRLRYVAASGEGAAAIIGTEMALADGLAGFAAASGQALVVDHPAADPRFARDIAERTGYVPESMFVVPVVAADGRVAGVLSVLDRTLASLDALALGVSFARLAADPLTATADGERTARVLAGAYVDAMARGEPALAPAVRRALGAVPEPDADVAAIAATLNDVRRLDDSTRARIRALVDDIVALAAPRRRGR